MPQSDFARLIRAIRDVRECTQKELGTLLGVSDTTISDWESGRQSPREETMEDVAKRMTPSRLGRSYMVRGIAPNVARRRARRAFCWGVGAGCLASVAIVFVVDFITVGGWI
jgi:transcriptional regulator with XRE-family HTH domain